VKAILSGNQNWLGTGDLGHISRIQAGEEVSPYGIQLTLSGLDPDLVGEAIKEIYYQRPVTLYVGALNDSDQLVATPDVMWTGFMDLMTASVGADGGDTLVLNCESELAMFERSRNLLFTNSSQQTISSGDTFFNNETVLIVFMMFMAKCFFIDIFGLMCLNLYNAVLVTLIPNFYSSSYYDPVTSHMRGRVFL